MESVLYLIDCVGYLFKVFTCLPWAVKVSGQAGEPDHLAVRAENGKFVCHAPAPGPIGKEVKVELPPYLLAGIEHVHVLLVIEVAQWARIDLPRGFPQNF